MKKERLINYDCMRLLMSFLVMGIHTPFPQWINNNQLLYNLVICFFFQCNGVFFMLSGSFCLSKNFKCKQDYIDYYVSKFINIFIPYCIATGIIVFSEKQFSNINQYISKYIEAFYVTNNTNILWFMNWLIDMLVSAPFLAKMLVNMRNFELKILFKVGIVWNFISYYLTENFGTTFPFFGWFLSLWLFVFILGYVSDRIINDTNIKIIYCLGIVGFIITVLGLTYLEIFVQSTSVSVGYIFFTMSCYLFIKRTFNVNNSHLKKIISFLAQHSFFAYMIHIIVLNQCRKYITPENGIIQWILCVVLDFIGSYLLSILLSYILIRPFQKLLSVLLNNILKRKPVDDGNDKLIWES